MGNLLSMISRSTILGFGDDIIDAVSNVVGSVLWAFCDIFFIILDLFEELYRKFAGIDTNVTTASGEAIEGDLVLYFIQSDIVQQIFMSIFILSLFLLIIFTIFAIVKNQYAEKQEPVSKIVNSSVKALLMYLLVPIATIVCLLVGNVVLQAIDGATKTNDYAQTVSDNLFTAATYNANRFRSGSVVDKAHQLEVMLEDNMLPQHIMDLIEQECNVDLSDTDSFKMVYVATGESVVDYDTMAIIIDEAFITGNFVGADDFGVHDKTDFTRVNDFYYALKISYITIWIGGAFLIWAIGKITWGLVARLFKMTLYYAISPAVMATFPIDNGKALGSWRGEMVKNGTMALCSVGILNVLYSVLPAFNNIDLYGDSTPGGGLASAIVRLFIYIIAFSSAKDLVGAISGWFGTGDALGEGTKAKGQVTAGFQQPKKLADSMSKKAIAVGGAFTGIKGGMSKAEDIAKSQNLGKFRTFTRKMGGAVSGALTGSGLREASGLDSFGKALKSINGKEDEASKYYEESKFRFDKDGEKKYKASKTIKKQGDEINDVLERLDDRFNQEVADSGLAVGSGEYNRLKEYYDKQKTKVKADAGFLKPLYEKEDKDLELEKQMLEEHSKQFEAVDSAFKADEQEDKYKKMFEQRLRDVGATSVLQSDGTLSPDQWENIKRGNIDSKVIGHYTGRQAAEELYEQIGLRIQDNDAQKEKALEDVKKLYNNGGESYLKGILGDIFTQEGVMNTKAAGAETKYQDEKKKISDEMKKLNKNMSELVEKKAKTFDNRSSLSQADLSKIADSEKKS